MQVHALSFNGWEASEFINMAAYSNSRSMRLVILHSLISLMFKFYNSLISYCFSFRFEDDIESKPRTMFTLSKSNKVHPEKQQQSLKHKVLSRVFSEDYSSAKLKKKILDPRGSIIHRWNKIFLLACIVSLFVDPLFFYLTETQSSDCINIDTPLEVVLTIIRSLADVFYAMHIFIKFRTAYVAPSSRVFGRGELIIDPSKIACRYINSKSFWLDLFAALPLPQVTYILKK